MKKVLFTAAAVILFCCTAKCSMIVVGLPWHDVHAWRYWERNDVAWQEYLLIVNERKAPIGLQFLAEQMSGATEVELRVDSAIAVEGGVCEVAAGSYSRVRMPKLPANHNGNYLFRVNRTDTAACAHMDLSSKEPTSLAPYNRIITTEGINESGGSHQDYWWEHSAQIIPAGARTTVRLTVVTRKTSRPGQYVAVMHWTDTAKVWFSRQLTLLRVSAGTIRADSMNAPDFPYKDLMRGNPRVTGVAYTIPPFHGSSTDVETYALDFEVQAPEVHSVQVAWLSVGIPDGSFDLPMVVEGR